MFEPGLKWRGQPENYEPDQRKILLALSNKRWLWRTLESLQRATRLQSPELTEGLKELMDVGLVRGSVSRGRREPIYGLVERVGPGRARKIG